MPGGDFTTLIAHNKLLCSVQSHLPQGSNSIRFTCSLIGCLETSQIFLLVSTAAVSDFELSHAVCHYHILWSHRQCRTGWICAGIRGTVYSPFFLCVLGGLLPKDLPSVGAWLMLQESTSDRLLCKHTARFAMELGCQCRGLGQKTNNLNVALQYASSSSWVLHWPISYVQVHIVRG